ncbi:MAG: hypothetical protein SVZ03_13670 [Spirochaetota bacterium]|nr:hypothetical protein [Spirochaetota bacterium]
MNYPLPEDSTINAAKGVLDSLPSLNPVEDIDTNIATMAQALVDAEVQGVIVTVSDASGNDNIEDNGDIIYTASEVTGNVVFALNKGTAAEATSTVSAVVPANAKPTAAFKNEIVVSGAAIGECNGSYFEDTENGPINGRPLYKHGTEGYYIYLGVCTWDEARTPYPNPTWWIDEGYTGPDRMYRVDDVQDTFTPPSGDWTTSCWDDSDLSTPTVLNLGRISGLLWAGQTLTAPEYTYQDADGDPEGATLKEWYRYDDKVCTKGETLLGCSTTYTLESNDIGKYIRYSVTPVAGYGNLTGTSISSPVSGPVIAAPPNSYVATSDGTSGVDGVFNLVGAYAGSPKYKHESEEYYIMRCGCDSDWRIRLNYSSYHYRNIYANSSTDDIPPSDGWDDYPCGAMGTPPTLTPQ